MKHQKLFQCQEASCPQEVTKWAESLTSPPMSLIIKKACPEKCSIEINADMIRASETPGLFTLEFAIFCGDKSEGRWTITGRLKNEWRCEKK